MLLSTIPGGTGSSIHSQEGDRDNNGQQAGEREEGTGGQGGQGVKGDHPGKGDNQEEGQSIHQRHCNCNGADNRVIVVAAATMIHVGPNGHTYLKNHTLMKFWEITKINLDPYVCRVRGNY